MGRPDISIVIRAYNEAPYLPGLLDAIRVQSASSHETIVVDSGSIDGTRDIAERKADKLLRIQSRDFTFGYSLNVGIKAAQGRLVAIVSAHTLPLDNEWLKRLVDPLQDESTAMVYGGQVGGPSSRFSEIQDLRRTFGRKRKILQPPNFFANNANSAIRKDLWHQHPFDESLMGLEDIEWAKHWMERGYRVVYEPDAALYHIHHESWHQVRRRYYREAVAARWIGVKGARQAFFSPAVEGLRLVRDWAAYLMAGDHRRSSNLGFRSMIRETTLFRANKSIGTMKGLLDGGIMQNSNSREKIFFDRDCQAVVIRRAGEAALEDMLIPEVKPGDVLIRVAYEGVCATDIDIFNGTLGYYKNGIATYPIVPGHELSGTIVDKGPNVDHLQPGDSVVVECIQSCGVCEACRRENEIACPQRRELGVIGRNGGYAEYVVVPGRYAHILPPGFDMAKACLCEPLAVALKGLKRLRRTWRDRKTPRKCAVVGAGALGHLCARVLALWGHAVTVFDRNHQRLELFNGSGIAVSEDLGLLGEYTDLVEATGNPEALETVIHTSPAGARILLLGLPYARREFSFESIVAYDKILVGSVGSALAEFKKAWEMAQTGSCLKTLLKVS